MRVEIAKVSRMQRRRRNLVQTYVILELVLIVVLIIEVLIKVIIIVKVLVLEGLAGEVVNRTGNDLHVSRQCMNIEHATGRRTFSLISSPSW